MIRTAGAKLQKHGFACVGLTIAHGQNGKRLGFHSGWQKAKAERCEEYFTEGDNAVAIVTGDASDTIVIDVDKAKEADLQAGRRDGLQLMDILIAQHGLPSATPVQQTGSGGRHYFFSLSESLSAGLKSAQNRTKLMFDNQATTIDIR